MSRLGVADNAFYRLACRVRDAGATFVTGPTTTTPFRTTRGIKQGCPLSPALFSILLAGLHRLLDRQATPSHVPVVAGTPFPAFSYADNITLLGYSPESLQTTHLLTEHVCTMLGLVVSPTQYEAVRIGAGPPTIALGEHVVHCSEAIRILGFRIASDGSISRWCADPDAALHRLHRNLAQMGLLANPRVFLRAAQLSVLPATLSGCELWGAPHVSDCLAGRANPYRAPALEGLLTFLRSATGLPRHSFTAAVY